MLFNQDFMILSRKGQLMVSQISGGVRPLLIHEPDVLLLSAFFQDQDPQQAAVDFLAHPWIKRWLPHLQMTGVQQRIEQFEQAGLFGPSEHSNQSLNPVPLSVTAPVALPDELALSAHAAISVHQQGFFACAGSDPTPHLLPTAWVILMLATV